MATPVYGVILVVSLWMYVYVMRAMRCRIETGADGLQHEVGRVVEANAGKARVRIHSEVWNAISRDPLRRGDWVRVLDIDGLTLHVGKMQLNG
ncbi:MAG: hypothetical protein GTO41_15925 [Burkholderiales bacterium]|nr:hypothetical protein [Burkholderiales bacterium]